MYRVDKLMCDGCAKEGVRGVGGFVVMKICISAPVNVCNYATDNNFNFTDIKLAPVFGSIKKSRKKKIKKKMVLFSIFVKYFR